MSKIIAVLAIWALGFGCNIAVMLYGWGVQPESWGWIIGGGLAAPVLYTILGKVAKEADNER